MQAEAHDPRKRTSSLKSASIGIPCTPTAADKALLVSASAKSTAIHGIFPK
jgi:hypothetical protein